MTIAVHNFIDLVNLQTVCKSTDFRFYKSIDSPCQNTDFHSPSVFKEKLQLALNIIAVVTCLQTYCEKIHIHLLSKLVCAY